MNRITFLVVLFGILISNVVWSGYALKEYDELDSNVTDSDYSDVLYAVIEMSKKLYSFIHDLIAIDILKFYILYSKGLKSNASLFEDKLNTLFSTQKDDPKELETTEDTNLDDDTTQSLNSTSKPFQTAESTVLNEIVTTNDIKNIINDIFEKYLGIIDKIYKK